MSYSSANKINYIHLTKQNTGKLALYLSLCVKNVLLGFLFFVFPVCRLCFLGLKGGSKNYCYDV